MNPLGKMTRHYQEKGETVVRFLDEELPVESEEGIINWSEADETVEQEIAAYHRLHSELWRKYPGQHVAIQNGRMVDHDADGLALSRRIYSRFPDTFVLIRQVDAQPERVIQLRSPRFVQDAT